MKVILKITVISGLSLFFSCGGDTINNPDPVTGANIIGSVNLYDEGTSQVDNSGMIVKIGNLSPLIQDTTDSDGNFVLQDVPFGTYTLIFEKAGYGTYNHQGLEHINTGSSTVLVPSPSLGQFASTKVMNLEVTAPAGKIAIAVTTDPAGSIGNTRYLRFLYSTDNNVDQTHYSYHSADLISQNNPYTLELNSTDLAGMGFSPASTVYVKVYGDSFWSNEYETDSGKKVFPNLNPVSADAVSFLVP